jgi:ABC-type bacteriocin/lantibiotic exporter with double-glycine peptidase domain
MQYWSAHDCSSVAISADPDKILQALYSSQVHGIYASKLENYLKQHGFRTFVLNGTWQDLQDQLQKGRPLIVALKPAGGNALHYLVVAGINPKQNVVMVNDPAERKLLKQDRTTFEKDWSATRNWLLLAVPSASAK